MKYTNICMSNKQLVQKLCLIVALVLFLSSCAYRFQNTKWKRLQKLQGKKIEELLYIQGRVSLKNSDGTLLLCRIICKEQHAFFRTF